MFAPIMLLCIAVIMHLVPLVVFGGLIFLKIITEAPILVEDDDEVQKFN